MKRFKKKTVLRNTSSMRHRHLLSMKKSKRKVARHRHIEFFGNSSKD
ncbi:MAG: hypothetical protein ACI4VX_06940 [Succinivibrionaceae bacterium]